VHEHIINGKSAQLGCTAPFTSVYAGKYKTEEKLKIQTIKKLNTTQKKQTTQNTTKENYLSLVASNDTRPQNEMGLFYNTPEPIQGTHKKAWLRSCDYTN